MADAILRMNVAGAESLPASAVGKKAYFFDTFANALASLDDTDLSASTGLRSPKAVNLLTNAVGLAISGKGVTIDNNGNIICSLDNGSDHFMTIPGSGLLHEPMFINAERLN